jgi:hypothetical protein
MRIRHLGLLLGMLLMAAPAWSAVTWGMIRNSDCTGLRAASVMVSIAGTPTTQTTTAAVCCLGAGAGFCDNRNTAGVWFASGASFVAVGAGAYTLGGDPIPGSELQKTHIDTITNWQCEFLVDNTAATPGTASGVIKFPVMTPNGGNPACTASVTPSACCTGAKTGTCGTGGQGTTVKLFSATGTEQTAGTLAGTVLDCVVTGY